MGRSSGPEERPKSELKTMTDGLRENLQFGPFELSIRESALRRDGVALPLGDRALDILNRQRVPFVGTRFVCERASETLVGEALSPRAQDVSRPSMSSKWRPNGGMKLVIGNLRIAARVCL
jgi:hypothetical protein